MKELAPYSGGRTVLVASAVVGIVGLLLTAIGFAFDPKRAILSYLVAFLYFLGLALGMLGLNMANHAARARWHVVIRRIIEVIHSSLPIFVVLFIPILLAARHLFVWIDPPASLGKEVLEKLQYKSGWLNFPFFIIRAVVYFAIWLVVSEVLFRLSVAQDLDGASHWTRSQRRWGSVGLPLVGFSVTFAAFDWIMSLDPTWYSTLFGVYYISGFFLAALALLTIVVTITRDDPASFGAHVGLAHFHNLGKLLLAFTAFWAYIAFSQYMLMWHANLALEIGWVLVRTRGDWRPIGVLLVFGQFLVPFFLLLSRDLKLRPVLLSALCGWLLFIHWIDLMWLVMPTVETATIGTKWHPAPLNLHWTLLTAFAGVGGVSVAFALWRARGHYPIPVGDPFLEDSLAYVQP
jgi:hypothetical protein